MQAMISALLRKMVKVACWLCLASIAVLSATLFVYSKLYVVAVILGPFFGLLSFGALVASLRPGKQAVSGAIPVLFISMSTAASKGGLLWGLPQSLAIATFFMAFPLIVFSKPIGLWLNRKNG